MAFRFKTPLHRIMDAQKTNLQRLGTGITLDGDDDDGNPKVLSCPAPNYIRLWDHPLRLMQAWRLRSLERAITIYPVKDTELGRITRRRDGEYEYWVHLLVQLTREEQEQDEAGHGEDDLLAVKFDHLLNEVTWLIQDNHLLKSDDCPNGLVQSMSFDELYTPSNDKVVYPVAHGILRVHGELVRF